MKFTGENPETDGERFSATVEVSFGPTPGEIPAGTQLVNVEVDTPTAWQMSDIYGIREDLRFSLACFRQVEAMGIPNANDTISRACVASAILFYARPFGTGVRTRLSQADLADIPNFDLPLHDFLVAVRDKHIAHAVNAFEHSQPIALVVAKPGELWASGHAAGVSYTPSTGLNGIIVRQSIVHVEALVDYLGAEIGKLRNKVIADFEEAFQEHPLKPAAWVKALERESVAKKRKGSRAPD